jgi:hypothetical protein
MDNRPGCLGGILRLFLLGWLFDWLQDNFGFGRGLSCSGCGCGFVLLIIFIALVCSTLSGTDWGRLLYDFAAGVI